MRPALKELMTLSKDTAHQPESTDPILHQCPASKSCFHPALCSHDPTELQFAVLAGHIHPLVVLIAQSAGALLLHPVQAPALCLHGCGGLEVTSGPQCRGRKLLNRPRTNIS